MWCFPKFRSARRAADPVEGAARREVLDRYEGIGRRVASRLSRGNGNIAAGRFMTARDLARRKAALDR